MINLNVVCGSVCADKIKINKNELAKRLKADRGFEHVAVDLCIEEFNKAVNYRYAYVAVPVEFAGENVCNLGFGNIQSANLYNVLKGCKTAIILAVTTGIDVDRLLSKYSVTSASKHFIGDAVGSAAAESLCDYVDDLLRKNPNKPHRFSPGYGDLELTFQKKVLEVINSQKLLGISLNKSLLMSPMKSITAIMGVKNDKNN